MPVMKVCLFCWVCHIGLMLVVLGLEWCPLLGLFLLGFSGFTLVGLGLLHWPVDLLRFSGSNFVLLSLLALFAFGHFWPVVALVCVVISFFGFPPH